MLRCRRRLWRWWCCYNAAGGAVGDLNMLWCWCCMLARVANWFYFYSLFLLRLLPSSMQATSAEAAAATAVETSAATLRNRPHALRLPLLLAFLNVCACVLARLRRANILPAFAIHTYMYVGGPEAAPPEDTTHPQKHHWTELNEPPPPNVSHWKLAGTHSLANNTHVASV